MSLKIILLFITALTLSNIVHAEIKPEAGKHYTIYLLAGQSNMDGRGKTADLKGELTPYADPLKNVLIRYSSGGHKRKLRESAGLIHLQPGCNENPAQFGPELSFGHAIAKARPQQNILLIKVSEGGTNLRNDWNPENPKSLYRRLIQLTGETREHLTAHNATHEIAGMIWHQGESDAGNAATYDNLLTAFITRLRNDLELPQLPFVIGEVCSENPAYQHVINAQKNVAKTLPAVGFASSKRLTTHDKNVHFDFASIIELGQRFAKELLALTDKREANASATTPPNIVLILADDLGYGDIACYNPESKIPTPRIDQLAKQGLLFTDAHSPATVCTPTRYGILTGRMAFRTGFRSVFTGVGGPCLIEKERLTLPTMLQEHNYATALFGKWHLGMTFSDDKGNPINDGSLEAVRRIDYSRPVPDGPLHRGFDHFFGTVSCPTTDFLYAYVDGDRIPVPPTGMLDKSTIPDHFYALDCRDGFIAPDFDLEQVDEVFLKKSQDFLKNHASSKPDQPFFLFLSCQAVHLPSFPAPQFQGKTNAGPHGDFIFQFDAIVGRLLDSLEKLGVADNTLVIVTSDNGPELPTVQHMRETHRHDGARPWRGVKRDNWEGGHRVPLIVRWPEIIEPGRKTSQTVSLTDLMATTAEILGHKLPENAGEDSVSLMPLLTNQQAETEPLRRYTLQESIRGFSLRSGPWKYLDHTGSGGNNYEREGAWGAKTFALPDTVPDAPAQLYHLERDPGERNNLYLEHPEIVEELKTELHRMIQSNRSTPLPR